MKSKKEIPPLASPDQSQTSGIVGGVFAPSEKAWDVIKQTKRPPKSPIEVEREEEFKKPSLAEIKKRRDEFEDYIGDGD